MNEVIQWPNTNIITKDTKDVILKSLDADIEKIIKKIAALDDFTAKSGKYIDELKRLFKMKDYCKNINSPVFAKHKGLLITYLKKKKVCPHRSKSEVAAFVEGW
ncbi:hypothetical protein FCV62_18980 [Vibrio kanaloae]|uniref:hypothetical protein n=1 Tax=Vibrio kanaloae TaxID=170673 RepID=UPI0010BEAE92|nr:hypothetical protein [Vibrio kanaloae]TKF76130.1 hypothetical protein FCV62_18980 [Vibrio kanaloae]